jgi:DNA (cytosine-5)-methyltransferase 1
MKNQLTAVSLFSGCGGSDLGAIRSGVKIIWANDIDPKASSAYHALLPEVPFIQGDIQAIREFPRADILIGCYPCTGFSGGARRRWHSLKKRNLFAKEANYLYRQFVRALRQVQPKYFFIENVRGMVSAEDGWFLRAQIRNFNRLGFDIQYRVLDASDFGLPQSRKRMFIVGVRRGRVMMKYEFPTPLNLKKKPTMRDAIGGMELWPKGEFLEYPFHGHYLTRNRKRLWDEQSYTIVAHSHHVPLHPEGEPMTFVRKDTWKLNGKFNRRLSWRECAALQGLIPLAIEESGGTLDDKYRIVGNAVPPILAESIIRPVVEYEMLHGHR